MYTRIYKKVLVAQFCPTHCNMHRCKVSLQAIIFLNRETIEVFPTKVRKKARIPILHTTILEKEMAAHSSTPGKFHGWKSLVGYSPWGHKESDMTE